MNKLYVMVGIPGSGKSTFIKNHLKETDKVVSRDEIRFSLVAEEEEYFSHEKEVFRKYVDTIAEYLAYGNDVYADATHLNESSRGKLLRALGKSLVGVEIIAVYIKVPVTTAITQNELRKGRSYVPTQQIKRMKSSLTEPMFLEGFHQIYIVEQNQKIKHKIDFI